MLTCAKLFVATNWRRNLLVRMCWAFNDVRVYKGVRVGGDLRRPGAGVGLGLLIGVSVDVVPFSEVPPRLRLKALGWCLMSWLRRGGWL